MGGAVCPQHPFYVKEWSDAGKRPKPVGHEDLNEPWVGAGHLKVGDKIKQADGTNGVVANVLTLQQTREMFNLTVSEAHTYYVGQDGWLVHNCNSEFTGPRTRHYTNRKGLSAIQESDTLKASSRQWESGCIFCEPARKKPMSGPDAEDYYKLAPGKGRDFIEFNTKPGEVREVINPVTGRKEWVIDGDIKLDGRNPAFNKKR